LYFSLVGEKTKKADLKSFFLTFSFNRHFDRSETERRNPWSWVSVAKLASIFIYSQKDSDLFFQKNYLFLLACLGKIEKSLFMELVLF